MTHSSSRRQVRSLLDPRTRGRRWVPFVLVTLAAIASAFFPGGHVDRLHFAWSLTALAGCLPLLRFGARATRGFTNLAGALAYLTFVGLLVTAQGGVSKSGLFTLALLPILWVALYSPRWKAIVVTTGSSFELFVLSQLDHESADLVLRKVLFWLLITTGLTISVRQLRDRFSGALRQRDQTIEDVEAIARTLRTLTSLRDPDDVLKMATKSACELTSGGGTKKRRCSYFVVAGQMVESVVDDQEHKVLVLWPISDHPGVHRAAETLEPHAGNINPESFGPAIKDSVAASHMTHGAWVPVLRGGRLHGVLAVAGRDEPIEGHVMSLLSALARAVESALDIATSYSDLEELAGIDPLTGLSNRRGLVRNGVSSDGGYVVISADLDGLKNINDTLGHDKGDQALAQFAAILQASVRQGTTIARIGGDEFVLILDNANTEIGWVVARRILATLCDPSFAGLRASFGIASSDSGASLDKVMKRADEAMYQAKRAGGMRALEWKYEITSADLRSSSLAI